MKLIIPLLLTLPVLGCAQHQIVEMQSTEQHMLQDADADGVIDAREQCQGTGVGVEVDNYGCGEKVVRKLDMSLELNFKHDSAELGKGDLRRIEALAKYLQLHPTAKVTLDGHTSKVGSEEYNMKLGLARAESVKQALINEFGIAADRIQATSHGYKNLKRAGESENAHASNRRVEATSDPFETQNDVLRWTIYTPGK